MTEPLDESEAPPPWAWSNLTPEQAEDLDARLHAWIAYWNHHQILEITQLIPACWRQHPTLVQELPVQFYAWDYIHRTPGATALEAASYYTQTLPSFRARLSDQHGLLGPDSSGCRAGKHHPPPQVIEEIINRADTDTDAHGPNNLDVLRNAAFGT